MVWAKRSLRSVPSCRNKCCVAGDELVSGRLWRALRFLTGSVSLGGSGLEGACVLRALINHQVEDVFYLVASVVCGIPGVVHSVWNRRFAVSWGVIGAALHMDMPTVPLAPMLSFLRPSALMWLPSFWATV